MADNYLERQRELYEVRKAAWEKKKKYGVKHASKPLSLIKQKEITVDKGTNHNS